MKDTYPYLKDPRALAEIRKHRWIESQKMGEEIGFATAAVDWIKKYGKKWKQIHGEEYKDNSIFLERRKYRRFKLDTIIELIRNNTILLAKGIDISFFGLLCESVECLPVDSEVGIRLLLRQGSKKSLICRGVIDRALSINSKKYSLFLRFDNHSQEKIENWEFFKK